MPEWERILLSFPDAPWLPPGGRADVLVAGTHAVPPEPTCLVRVLATGGGRICTRPRADGRGLDIPTRRLAGMPVEECLRGLLQDALGGVRPTTLLGYVRNVVAVPTKGYEWPTPAAYFVVWHCELPPDDDVSGVWLAGAEARAEMGERHWWPLTALLPVDALG